MRLGVRGKIFLLSFLLVLAVLGASGMYVERELRASREGRIEQELVRLGRAARALAAGEVAEPRGPGEVDRVADRIAEVLDVRVTLIGADGTVLGDSEVPASEVPDLEDHGARPEVEQARSEGRGVSRRYSTTLEDELLYVALPLPEEAGTVRVAMPLAEIDAAVARLRFPLLFAGLLGLAGATLIAGVASYLMSRTLRGLVDGAYALAAGARRERIEVTSRDELAGLAGSVNKMAEEVERSVSALAAERARFEAVLEGMSDAIIALDAERCVTLMNPAARALLDIGEVPYGRSLLELIRAPALQELVEAPGAAEPGSAEFDVPGVGRRVLARVTPQRGGGLILVLHDMTELRRLERVRRDFVANVSHELRTPVSVIRANLETLEGGALADGEHGPVLLGGALRNCERLTHIIEDLLDLSRLEANRYELSSEEVRVAEVARRAAESSSREIEQDCPEDLACRGDGEALEQVLVNLLDNADKYTPPEAEVRVAARQSPGGGVRIEVRDTGPGIEPAHRDRVFERFYRVDPGRSRQMGGTGLGLSIVKHLVEAMDGRVGVEANDPRGTIFWIELPPA